MQKKLDSVDLVITMVQNNDCKPLAEGSVGRW